MIAGQEPSAQEQILANESAKALQNQKKEMEGLTSATYEQITAQLSLIDKEYAAAGAYDRALEAIEQNGATLDKNTEKGRNNQAALSGMISAQISHIKQLQDEGASQNEINRITGNYRSQLDKVLKGLGLTKDEADRYRDMLNRVPKNINTDVRADTSKARTAVDDFVMWAGQKVIWVEGDFGIKTPFPYRGKARGGIIEHAASGIYKGRPGGLINFAEQKTGWEAYISGLPAARARNKQIWAMTGDRLGIPAPNAIKQQIAVNLEGTRLVLDVAGTPIEAIIRKEANTVSKININKNNKILEKAISDF